MEWKRRGNAQTIEQYFLTNLGVESLEDVNNWFRKSYANGYNVPNLKDAVELAKTFKEKRVTVVGDYDVDGVSATHILVDGLKLYGFKDVHFRIPHRFSEGFGISENIIDEIPEGLVLTCDNGIAGIDAIRKAKEKGLTVIVTDHHMPVLINEEKLLPAADIIVDPKVSCNETEFDGYCGAGIAYKFISELFGNDKSIKGRYLPFAAIATVCDVMPLTEENYVFVRNGLKMLSNPDICPVGIRELLYTFGMAPGSNVSVGDVGFKIGPALNSASRMADAGAVDALSLLSCQDVHDAIVLSQKLYNLNATRKEAERELTAKAEKYIEDNEYGGCNPIMAVVDGTQEGVLGIVASNLADRYKVPTFVLARTSDGCLKGSARSYGNYDVKAELNKCQNLLVRYGGHTGAAGLTLKEADFLSLFELLNANNTDYLCEEDKDHVFYDMEIEEKDIAETIASIEKLAPFGEGNPEPVFLIRSFSPVEKFGERARIMGKTGDSIKIYGVDADAVSFSLAKEIGNVTEADRFSFIGRVGGNVFNGHRTNQINIIDYKKV